MTLFPLQTVYFKESDPRTATIFLAILGVLIAILVINNIARNGIGGGSLGSAPRSRFSRWALRKAAAGYGLEATQTALLERVFRKAQVLEPETTLANQELLDRHFKRAYKDIEESAETEAIADEEKALLFSIRSAVDQAHSSSARVVSTRKLPAGLTAMLTGPKGETYPTKIISAKGDRLLVEAPKNAIGTSIKIPRGTKLTFSFYTKSSQGYRFESKALSSEVTPQGPALELSHSDRVSPLPNRRYRRKEARISCYFSLVQILQRMKGRKVVKETIVDERRALGTIMDISAGGCAIKSSAAFRTGEYVKIEFDDHAGKTLAAFGRIVRTNRTGSVGGVMHIQFLKTTRKAINTINAIVYGYEQE